METSVNLDKIHHLTKTLREQFADPHYELYRDEHLDYEDSIQLRINHCTTPHSYEEDLLTLADELVEYTGLVTAYVPTKNKDGICIWILEHLKTFITGDNLIFNTVEGGLGLNDFPKLILRFNEFEMVRKQSHSYLISRIKGLTSAEYISGIAKFKWLGQQKQLGELFGVLIIKGWIADPITKEDVSEKCDLLDALFDLSNTKRKDSNADSSDNLRKALRNTLAPKNFKNRKNYLHEIFNIDVHTNLKNIR